MSSAEAWRYYDYDGVILRRNPDTYEAQIFRAATGQWDPYYHHENISMATPISAEDALAECERETAMRRQG